MKITVTSPDELGQAEVARWRELQLSTPTLASPCFSREFAVAVAAVRPDVRVAVLEQDNRVLGFFAHQQRWSAGEPAGGRLSDHHGVVAAPGTQWDWAELLRASGLSFWQFDHLAAWQRPPGPVAQASSPGLDLSRGFEAYRQGRLAAGARRLAELPRKSRKLAREVGPLRFESNTRDPRVLQTVIRLKSEQCHRTGALDCFGSHWARELVTRIAAADHPEFAGRLSALYAGDALVAAHLGMRSSRTWHWWFPVYSHAHAAYSPGALLLLEVARAAAAEGCGLLDLGKGDEPYKTSFADCALPLVEGLVSRPTLVTLGRSLKKRTGAWLRSSPWATPLRPLIARRQPDRHPLTLR
ncbi:GNAT family N-acetyltransferase [Ramlibacter sp.]|uniref:GNAT family N-acetyltransferase n=1 Tax=Ramlibacter sp. TaxID=1917967 RepID=UPI002FC85897